MIDASSLRGDAPAPPRTSGGSLSSHSKRWWFGGRSERVLPMPPTRVPVTDIPVAPPNTRLSGPSEVARARELQRAEELRTIDELGDFVLGNPFLVFMCPENSREEILEALTKRGILDVLRDLKEDLFVWEDLLAPGWISDDLLRIMKRYADIPQILLSMLFWSATKCAIRAAGVVVRADHILVSEAAFEHGIADVAAAIENVEALEMAEPVGVSPYPEFYKKLLLNAAAAMPIMKETGPYLQGVSARSL